MNRRREISAFVGLLFEPFFIERNWLCFIELLFSGFGKFAILVVAKEVDVHGVSEFFLTQKMSSLRSEHISLMSCKAEVILRVR